jgi:hypothetical protein
MTAVERGCVPAMKPMVMAASLAQSGGLVAAKGGPLKLIQSCPCNPDGRPPLAARRAIDDKLFCAVMCCCNTGAAKGAADQRLMQQCVNDVFNAADEDLNWKSRYKSEISYVMSPPNAPGQPMPLMSRTTGIATKPTEYWQGGARAQLGDTWVAGLGMVRRPDIVVVNDPCQPPVGGNIERVVEMKFEGDTSDTEQNEAYRQIAGGANKYSVLRAGGRPQAEEEPPCDCGSDENRRYVPVLTPEAQAEQERKANMIKTAAGAGAVAAGGMAVSEVLEAVLVGLLAAL